MATIVVRRPRDAVARLRSYKVLLDGKQVARLRSGSSAVVEAEPGRHVIQARIDWTSSPPLELQLAEAEHVTVECRSPALGRAAYLGFVRPGAYLELRVVG
jgi:hypothetical protein